MSVKLFAVYNGHILLARKEKGTNPVRQIPAVFFEVQHANQIMQDFNSLLPGNHAIVAEIYPSFKPGKVKGKKCKAA